MSQQGLILVAMNCTVLYCRYLHCYDLDCAGLVKGNWVKPGNVW